MKIVLYSINYAPELTGVGKYNAEFCEHVAAAGHEVSVITAVPYYPEWKVAEGYANRWRKESVHGVTVYRSPLYVPTNPTTLKRLLHLVSFAASSSLSLVRLLRSSPDVLIALQPTLFTAPLALLWARLTGAQAVLHIQDFELDAMLGISDASPLDPDQRRKRGILASIETFVMRRFDRVSTISYNMLRIAADKGVGPQKLILFPNWADTSHVRRIDDTQAIRSEFDLSIDDRIILYSGNIGKKQGLEIVLDAAHSFRDRPDVKFLVIGAGAHAATLQAMAREQQLANVLFAPLQPWEKLPAILSMADVHLVVQKRGVADAVLPSKLTNILAVGGHALVTAERDTELGIVANAHPGIYTLVEPEQPDAFVAALQALLQQDTRAPNTIAINYARQTLEKNMVINRFMDDLENLVAGEPGSEPIA
jgi:colanic acid biosynthesis glycosyl transferase WcaI